MLKLKEDGAFSNSESSENGIESSKGISGTEENILNFLDSTDNYLILMESLSSALRQGWFELATARQSMGASRVNSALFDLKSHHASTTLQLQEHHAGPDIESPHFTLCKWASSDEPEKEAKLREDELLEKKTGGPTFQHKGTSPVKVDNQVEKERFKSLSIFGTLVSPKLRATQSSFEKALEMVVEISNVRASLLRAYDQAREDLKTTK